ncbi:1-acyl-sn-glycerol-3-phosphate acyltransferases [Reichenbachiella agariperforans]|uniref:1-acyl-sn-glycerol-3-phosphate acyltransferases n=1 Tax=Reichenbachiella agariperforans TaxID=156994 RepID=A0A1M6VHT1_REIAG|nr:1-acyl-sn-glycerol-3-phosphate acyltransferase [Reichenbachiella agariperforans]SHK80816.1 1-acyl-sn-glycerol-3-phosphate acyltransferases [Reichenbachiella agariperforans]
MLRVLFIFVFKLLGWRIEGNISEGLKKCVLIIAPHTSNWDFVIGVVSRRICGFQANYLIKKEFFKNRALAWFFDFTGGIPVDRKSKKIDVVGGVVDKFNSRDSLVLTITPEGTRSHVKEWKTGFYRIALRAKVPIVIVGFDYSKRLVKFIEEFAPTGQMEEDIAYIKSLYKDVKGKYPEKGVY